MIQFDYLKMNTALWKDIKTEQHYNLSGWVDATVELENYTGSIIGNIQGDCIYNQVIPGFTDIMEERYNYVAENVVTDTMYTALEEGGCREAKTILNAVLVFRTVFFLANMADSIGNARRFTDTYQNKDWDR